MDFSTNRQLSAAFGNTISVDAIERNPGVLGAGCAAHCLLNRKRKDVSSVRGSHPRNLPSGMIEAFRPIATIVFATQKGTTKASNNVKRRATAMASPTSAARTLSGSFSFKRKKSVPQRNVAVKFAARDSCELGGKSSPTSFWSSVLPSNATSILPPEQERGESVA